MKKKKKIEEEPFALHEIGGAIAPEQMVRTQVYLTREEHRFLQSESSNQGEPMAAIIRRYIDKQMEAPSGAWANNPILEPTLEDPEYSGQEDSSLNHDHYAYGAPKKYEKRKGKWALLAPTEE
jgi:hypothetical protein